MNVNEKLRILADVEATKFREIANLLASEQAKDIITKLNEIVFLRDMVERVRYTTEEIYQDLENEVQKVDNTVAAIADGSIFTANQEKPVEPVVAEPVNEINEIHEEANSDVPNTITKEELKTKLTAYANNGVDVGGVLASLGYKNLSSIPENKYMDVLSAVEAKA